MGSHTLIFFETGLNSKIPDLRNVSAASFPIWGDYYFMDCALSNFLPFDESRRLLLLEGVHRSVHSFAVNHWKSQFSDIAMISRGIEEFLEIIQAVPADSIILSSLSFVAFFAKSDLIELAENLGKRIVKLSIDHTPLDLYMANRKRLIDVIRSYQSRYRRQSSFGGAMFAQVLHSCFEELVDLSGRFVLQNNLHQMYLENLNLADEDSAIRILQAKLGGAEGEKPASSIGETGYVKRSHISSGVDIRGYVENSVIFPGVSVKAKTKILNSVIMNDNQIGSHVEVSNALIFPYTKEIMKGGSNVEDNVVIGTHSSLAKNRDFPDQIHDGLTVLGSNAVVPRGSVIEQGCYLGANIPPHDLKKMKTLKMGRSLYQRERFGSADDI